MTVLQATVSCCSTGDILSCKLFQMEMPAPPLISHSVVLSCPQAFRDELFKVRDHNRRWTEVATTNAQLWADWESIILSSLADSLAQFYCSVLPSARRRNANLLQHAQEEHESAVAEVVAENENARVRHAKEIGEMRKAEAEQVRSCFKLKFRA